MNIPLGGAVPDAGTGGGPRSAATPLRLAVLTDAPRVAGSELWLLYILPRLLPGGVRPTVFLRVGESLDWLAGQFGGAGIPVQRFTDLTGLPDLTRDFDLRLLQAWDPGTYLRVLPGLAAPTLVVSHDQLDYHYAPPLRALYRETYRFTKAIPLRRAGHLLTVSRWGADFLRGPMGLRDTTFVTNGVDPEQFRPATPKDRAALRAEFGFTRFTVLIPGRFTPEKNQWMSVRAARHAPDLDFVFVGDMDSSVGTLAQAYAKRLGLKNVRFLGRRWDMPELYRAADALLQPTLAENQSLVTLEAMASGLPVITTDIPAQTELVQDGVTGLTVPAQPDVLARALQALAAHPERTRDFGRAARQFVLDHHTTDHTAALVLAELRRLVPHPSPAAHAAKEHPHA
ncbi:glycosyltransferase family 4 protein [Deinococcus radiotolerans]|uniref:LPS biosynthesis protein n=1 Tax=Deinococcus radiotolerans TaxID=1309407 RepID=A0ABQ2FH27_9DEIO|nr:glycosyltransferase family 4 protein [Deinococcus radiotolerans]GGK92414.1 LPS biosynthesis protein [Deinococcus radiotolerans]